MSTRFSVDWHPSPVNAYTLSIPNFDGGEVVLASEYDKLRAQRDMLLAALDKISERDPQSSACGADAPRHCLLGCEGCIARAAITEAEKR